MVCVGAIGGVCGGHRQCVGAICIGGVWGGHRWCGWGP